MSNKGRAICTDIYDKDGNLLRIEAHTSEDNFLMQFLWDDRDEQNSTNREDFRAWAYRHLRQNGYEV
jgi:hypothetical protein